MICYCEFPAACDGSAMLHCLGCGGDFCVCLCGGEDFCEGCLYCDEPTGDYDLDVEPAEAELPEEEP